MDMVLKVFEGHMLPEGSVLLFVFSSFLHIVRVTVYAIAWTALVEKLNNKWINVKVCPLTPVIREDCPGSLARKHKELASRMVSVYQGISLSLSELWSSTLPALLIRNSSPTSLLETADRYWICLPSDISSAASLGPLFTPVLALQDSGVLIKWHLLSYWAL